MPTSDILKLVFHHDQRMDELAPSTTMDESNPLAMFTSPDPTFSTLYFSGTNLKDSSYGFDVLAEFDYLLRTMDVVFSDLNLRVQNSEIEIFSMAIQKIGIGDYLILGNTSIDSSSEMDKSLLRSYLERDLVVIFKEKAQHGFDIQMFSKKNIYTSFFYPLQAMLPDAFRFFSMNGKRVTSEQKFFFETWALDRPPHGTEEVHPESVL